MTPIQLDPNHQGNSFADTTLAQAQANTRFALQQQVDTVNASRVQDYETQWTAYAAARDARPDATNIIAPVPAYAEAVGIDFRGWPCVTESAARVIAPHTYVPAVKTPALPIFGSASVLGVLGSADALLVGAALFQPFSYGNMKFQRIA